MIHKFSYFSLFIAPLKEFNLRKLINLIFVTISFGTINNHNSQHTSMFSHFSLQQQGSFLHLLTGDTIRLTKQDHKCLIVCHNLVQLQIVYLPCNCSLLILQLFVDLEKLVGVLHVVQLWERGWVVVTDRRITLYLHWVA